MRSTLGSIPVSEGRVYEVTRDGVEHDWARITDWEQGERIVLDWHAGVPVSQATHVEITFRQTAEGTEMTLVHDGWEARGADAAGMRDSYETGWDLVLGRVPGSVAGRGVGLTGQTAIPTSRVAT